MNLRVVGLVALVLFLLHGHFAALFPVLGPFQLPLAAIAAGCALVVGWPLTRSTVINGVVAVVAALFILAAPPVTYITDYSAAKPQLLLLTVVFSLVIPPMLVRSRADLRVFLTALGAACLLIVALTMPSLPRILAGAGRLAIGEEGNPIWLARAAGLGALWLWVSVLTSSLRSRWLWALIPTLAVLVLTGSRGPLASLLLVGALLTPLLVRRVSLRGAVGALLAGGAGVALFLSPAFADEFASRFVRDDGSGISSGRDVLWSTAADYISTTSQGLGVGGLDAWMVARYPHNILLETFGELGWTAGTLLVIALLVALALLIRAAQNRRREEVLLLGIFLFALGNALVSGDLTSPKELYIAGALAWVVTALRRQVATDQPAPAMVPSSNHLPVGPI